MGDQATCGISLFKCIVYSFKAFEVILHEVFKYIKSDFLFRRYKIHNRLEIRILKKCPEEHVTQLPRGLRLLAPLFTPWAHISKLNEIPAHSIRISLNNLIHIL